MTAITADIYLTSQQQEALSQLKYRLYDILQPKHDDQLLLGFLRAKKFDVTVAEKVFRKDLEWRIQEKADTILEWYEKNEVCRKYWPGGQSGLDKDGHIVWIVPIGQVDPKGLLYSTTATDLLKTNICILENLQKQQRFVSEKLGKPIEGVTFIFDLNNFGVHHLWKPGMEVMGQIAEIAEQHYPGLIHKMFIIRPSKLFPAVYFMMKPFLHETTRKKIKVCGSQWKEILLKHVHAESLPMYWGGTQTDSDGHHMCRSKINVGGKVPTSYYMKNRELKRKCLTSYEIPSRRSIQIQYDVTVPGSVFRYEFKTESHGIDFGIVREREAVGKITILEASHYNCHLVPEDGEIIFDEPGVYTVTFDNHRSWTKSKKVSYSLELIEPKWSVDDGMLTSDND